MDNPFKKRRTELITDRKALLALVSPAPIEDFFRGDRTNVIEKLTMVVGTPGCGKTTIAQVVEFESLALLCMDGNQSVNRDLMDVLTQNNLIADGRLPAVLGHRLSMTTNFRDIWELPYAEQTRAALLRAFVQSKAVLGWFRQLEGMGVALTDVRVIMGANSESVSAVTGAGDANAFREYAREIELGIFKVVTALVPPTEEELARDFLNTGYDVFEVLQYFQVERWPEGFEQISVSLRPMMIVDDAHELHPNQFILLRDWLKSKAIGVSRWLMCRPDIVSPEDYRDALVKDAEIDGTESPGSTRGRDYLIKLMQLGNARERRFKSIALDISKRYINEIPEFTRRSISDLVPMLDTVGATLPEGKVKQLEEEVARQAKNSRFSSGLVETLRARVPASARRDEALAALRILMVREANRSPQLGLLPEEPEFEEPVTDERKASSSLVEGARIQLMHQFERPYYYGTDKLYAASNSNIEQFIRLSGALVDEVLARVIRNKPASLDPRAQHIAMVSQAQQTMRDWDFPYHTIVRELVKKIAERCVERTLRPNAPLDTGANAIGVLEEEMNKVLRKSERLARVLHFAFAYKALVFVPQYKCKNKVWCLLELGALPCMAYGLTLNRGGFIEDSLAGVRSLIDPEGAE